MNTGYQYDFKRVCDMLSPKGRTISMLAVFEMERVIEKKRKTEYNKAVRTRNKYIDKYISNRKKLLKLGIDVHLNNKGLRLADATSENTDISRVDDVYYKLSTEIENLVTEEAMYFSDNGHSAFDRIIILTKELKKM